MEERLTKKEMKDQRRMENLKRMEEGKNSGMMKNIVVAAVVILFLAFGAFLIYASKTATQQKANTPVKLSSSGQVIGNSNSKVTVTEFGDLQCPACLAFEPTMRQVRRDYGSKVKIVFKHFPLKTAHPNAMEAAEAAEAAGLQGKFWQYHDKLYDTQGTWAPMSDPTDNFIQYAKDLKLDITQFTKDLKSKSVADKINAQEDEGIKIGVNATPTIYVNGVFLGVPNYDTLKKAIDTALAKT